MEWIVESVARDCKKADAWGIEAITGIELTHVPVRYIDQAVRKARKAGAEIIVIHGETPVEPVERGTNYEAVSNADVDILAHPGMMSVEEAELAAEHDVYLEVSCRKGHSLANGHVANLARDAGARVLVNTDAHEPKDLSTMEFATKVARGSGMTPEDVRTALVDNPERMLKKLGRR
jgi:histidinol phosphatase-like PHP family hydrolase